MIELRNGPPTPHADAEPVVQGLIPSGEWRSHERHGKRARGRSECLLTSRFNPPAIEQGENERFEPGTLGAGRYRIVAALAGRDNVTAIVARFDATPAD